MPFGLVTSMFLLWGLANNMTDTLLAAFRRIMAMSDTETSLIQFAFYGSYFCFALPAALFIRRHSFKAGILLGLLLYAAGAMLFLPAAYAASYAFYLVAIYVMAGGCSVLETTANPYIMSMGSAETATRRLNIAQSFNPIGSILGILLSKYFILDDISLYSVSGTYTALGMVLLLILSAMLFVRMPGGSDGSDGGDSLGAAFRRLAANRLYRRGVVAQFFYIGAQIGLWSFAIRLVMEETGCREAEASNVYLLAIVGHCVSRFVYTWLMRWVAPERLLVAGGVLSTVASACVVAGRGTGTGVLAALVLASTFMSLMFPTIYGIALGGVARSEHPADSKIGASGLIMAILGGAVLTPVQGILSDLAGVYTSYLLPTFCFVVVTAYALYAAYHSAKARRP